MLTIFKEFRELTERVKKLEQNETVKDQQIEALGKVVTSQSELINDMDTKFNPPVMGGNRR